MSLIIAVDFDGTCVDHRYPDVGEDVPGAAEWLRKFVDEGARLILWTMRSTGRDQLEALNTGVDPLADAIRWFELKGLPLFGINANPEQSTWTQSPKAYAHVYIDDAAFGCPLLGNPRAGGRPFVDWQKVGPAVLARIAVAAVVNRTLANMDATYRTNHKEAPTP